jgi:hypothetical protein
MQMTDNGRTHAPLNLGLVERLMADERIARRAYEIYESRGRADGHAEDDWVQATAEYAARPRPQPTRSERYGAGSSFGGTTRKTRW